MSESITVTLNGTDTEFPADTSLAYVVASLGHAPNRPGVAAAVDGQVVRQTDWSETNIDGGQHIEILTAVQGGAR